MLFSSHVGRILAVMLVFGSGLLLAEPARDAKREATKEALEELNGLIGEWRGVGQVKRGSNVGSWTENSDWVWDLKQGQAAIEWEVKSGKHLASAEITYDAGKKQYVLTATLPDKSKRTYLGELKENKLTFESGPDDAGLLHQVAITLLSEKRTLVLFQVKKVEQEQFSRVAEIGYTREGTKLAIEGAGEPECVVTGGKGTSTIVYKGKTYYFCCSGCRDAFNDDPEGVIADYEKKLAKRKAEMK
jgi:YHS domain-containing protein